jgi:hypothetical protein
MKLAKYRKSASAGALELAKFAAADVLDAVLVQEV